MLTIKDIRVNGKRRTFTADRLNDFDVLLRRKNMRIYWRAPRKNGPVRVEAYRFGRPVKVALKFNATPPRKRFRRAASV